MKIQIFTCLTHNSTEFANFLKKNLEETSSKKNQITFFAIVDQNFVSKNSEWQIIDRVETPHGLFDGYGAKNHSIMLNKIINHIKDETDIVIICDCDVAVLQKNWDAVITSFHEKYDALITPKFSGKSSVYFTSFKKDVYLKIKPDFTPGVEENNFKVKTIFEDTGYKVQEQLKDYKFIFYDLVGFNKTDPSKYKSHKDFHYLYKLNGKNFLTHFGGSHKKDFKSVGVENWVNNISLELNKNE